MVIELGLLRGFKFQYRVLSKFVTLIVIMDIFADALFYPKWVFKYGEC